MQGYLCESLRRDSIPYQGVTTNYTSHSVTPIDSVYILLKHQIQSPQTVLKHMHFQFPLHRTPLNMQENRYSSTNCHRNFTVCLFTDYLQHFEDRLPLESYMIFQFFMHTVLFQVLLFSATVSNICYIEQLLTAGKYLIVP